jgi:transketolase
MRNEFASALIALYDKYPNQVFLTGDLGYMALEKVQEKFEKRFINAGVAEQNMVSMAAALAYDGFIPWTYSIAPFVTLRPYEQLRNDVCLHNLPVKIVGNGGGYGYGIMGATHHNAEDIGAMRLLPNMKVYIPFNATDVFEAAELMLNDSSPNYLRLNMAAKIEYKIAPFATWRKIKSGSKATIVGTGPVLQNIFKLGIEFIEDTEIWLVSMFPFGEIPTELWQNIHTTKKVITMEEHYAAGGLGESFAQKLLTNLQQPISFISLCAAGYPSGKYGSQQWHQAENNLEGENLNTKITEFLK